MAEPKSTGLVKFVSNDDLLDNFRYVNSKIPQLTKTSLELKVESDEQLVIAENNAKEVHLLIKEVDKVRKILKDPYANTVKMIDSYCKNISDNLDRIKVRFTAEITNYKVLQEAKLKMEKDQKLKVLEVLEKEKIDESDKITRIENQLVARIYGGSYKTKDGSIKTVTGCIKSSECVELLSWINTNSPDVSVFKHFPTLFEDMIIRIKKRLIEHQNDLLLLETKPDSPIAREGAMRRITESRLEANDKIQETSQQIEKLIEKSVKKETRTIDNEIIDAGKGVRETLTYEIVDELLVPRDMLSVDQSKIYSYLNANKDKIKQELKNGTEIIPGIKFFVESKFVAR